MTVTELPSKAKWISAISTSILAGSGIHVCTSIYMYNVHVYVVWPPNCSTLTFLLDEKVTGSTPTVALFSSKKRKVLYNFFKLLNFGMSQG